MEQDGIKLFCTILSLPVPPTTLNPAGEDVSQSPAQVLPKILLVGCPKSGTSMIYKQAKVLYNISFSENERQCIKSMIQSNLYGYLAILHRVRERFEEEIIQEDRKRQIADGSGSPDTAGESKIDGKTKYSISPRLKAFSDWLVQVMVSGNLEVIFPAATREYAPFIGELWNDAAFQATYNRRHELEMLPRIATYILKRANEILRTDYELSDMDISYAEGITSSNGLSCMEFSFPLIEREIAIDGYQHDPSARYQLIRLHPSSLGEKCKRLEMLKTSILSYSASRWPTMMGFQ